MTGPPSASRVGGIHVMLMELHCPESVRSMVGGYGTSNGQKYILKINKLTALTSVN